MQLDVSSEATADQGPETREDVTSPESKQSLALGPGFSWPLPVSIAT